MSLTGLDGQDGGVLAVDKLDVGAGTTKTLAECDDLAYEGHAIANSEAPTRIGYDHDEAKAGKLFANLAVETWWRLRLRFQKTWERVEQGIPHPYGTTRFAAGVISGNRTRVVTFFVAFGFAPPALALGSSNTPSLLSVPPLVRVVGFTRLLGAIAGRWATAHRTRPRRSASGIDRGRFRRFEQVHALRPTCHE